MHRPRSILRVAVVASLLVSACVDRARVDQRFPLTATNLEKARKQCAIADAALIESNTVRFSGLHEIGKPRDYNREWRCLQGKLLMSNAKWIIG